MTFGARKGVTTLGLWDSSAGLIRPWITNNMMKKAITLNPSINLRSTLKIRIELWFLPRSLRGLKSGLVRRDEDSSRSPSPEVFTLLRALLLLPPPVITDQSYWPWRRKLRIYINALHERVESQSLIVRSRESQINWNWTLSAGRNSFGVLDPTRSGTEMSSKTN